MEVSGVLTNRAEIAVSIIRACDARAIETMPAGSDADRDSLPANQRDGTSIGAAAVGVTK
jgi:acetyl/propionyl-CoA carboxylase alpha subunit